MMVPPQPSLLPHLPNTMHSVFYLFLPSPLPGKQTCQKQQKKEQERESM